MGPQAEESSMQDEGTRALPIKPFHFKKPFSKGKKKSRKVPSENLMRENRAKMALKGNSVRREIINSGKRWGTKTKGETYKGDIVGLTRKLVGSNH